MNLMLDKKSGLLLPRQFIDQKQALKNVLDKLVDGVVLSHQHLKDTYYISLHAYFDKLDPTQFKINQPVITSRLPPFCSNQFVFWVNNQKGICELLWMVSRKDGKLKIDFNTEGVAYLKAKGGMPQ